ncbi:hypothetical protein DK926_04920 [Rhodococcus sp. Eu-32]|uniref:hypothetical protein n=1 Tax=Rhodococcus sp. Eu-32 TaxID=1017319 RepID=UPI000F78EF9C|nr:hypothetical protein [Rhodococcus sp. Eu-32]RRQ29226.1 hypothetical protein DK926_04920 [Rhodococcus sp. Eu-32]
MSLHTHNESVEDEPLRVPRAWALRYPPYRADSASASAFDEWLELEEATPAWASSSSVHGSEPSAYHHGQQKIGEFLRESSIDEVMFTRAAEMMRYLFTSKTIFASIAPDDGDLIFYWKAAQLSIEIDLLANGNAWWSVDGIEDSEFTGSSHELPLVALKHYLNIFSKEVEMVNPSWRNLQEQ